MIAKNPLDRVKLYKDPTHKQAPAAYSANELAQLLASLSGHPGEAVVLLMSCCGLRKEEALALDWENINLATGEIAIQQAWTKCAGKAKMKSTKTPSSVRSVYIAGNALDRLRVIGDGKSGALWCGMGSNRIHPDSAYQSFKRHLLRTGQRLIPLSNMRHTHATVALASGVDVMLVSKNLGHARISTTVDNYVRPLEQQKQEASVLFATALSAAGIQ
jgi:integrase